jgi:hypothetical protein
MNKVRAFNRNFDTLPFMPMFEYELLPTIKVLQLIEQNIESYLSRLSERYQYHLSVPIDEERSEIVKNDDVRDSVSNTYSVIN